MCSMSSPADVPELPRCSREDAPFKRERQDGEGKYTKTRRQAASLAREVGQRRRAVTGLISLIGLCVLGTAIIAQASTQAAAQPPMQEGALKPKDTFKDCANCPEVVVVPAGSFTMGSPASEPGHSAEEGPQHMVTIARPFAVGRFGVTFDEWDACVADGGCNGYKPSDEGWGRGRRPVINVSWDDAQAYVTWLSKKTGKSYRLLSGAEYEYAMRAGTQTVYPWGNTIGTNNANCHACGSRWDAKRTAPVGSFPPNGFGLYDMVGNVREWTEDCYHETYNGAPPDGSAWIEDGNCYHRVVRGGSFLLAPAFLRSASRYWFASDYRLRYLGFRVARALAP
jgi:formylglycine-generating enzyme required for sulfatase activity